VPESLYQSDPMTIRFDTTTVALWKRGLMDAKDIEFNFKKPGEVYFVRERDVISGEVSQYTKIGLVGDRPGDSDHTLNTDEEDQSPADLEPTESNPVDVAAEEETTFSGYLLKNSEKRLKQHQTGNPNMLMLDASVPVVRTPSVSATEKALHHRFANLRIRGEWFMLDDAQLKEAIELAQKLAGRLQQFEKTFHLAREISLLDSSEEVITPDSELLDLGEHLKKIEHKLKSQVARASAIENQIAATMTDAIEIEGVAVWTFRKSSSRFNYSRFLEKHPEFKDVLTGSKRTQTLRLLGALKVEERNQKDIESDFSGSVKAKLTVGSRDSYLQDLHQEYLSLLKAINENSWERTILKDEIRVRFGEAQEIKGIANWKRETKSAILGSSAKAHLESIGRTDLITEFTDAVPESYSFKVLPMRPYPLS